MRPRVDVALAWRGDMAATIAQQQQCRSTSADLQHRRSALRWSPRAAHPGSSTGGLHDAALLVTPDGKRALLDIFNRRHERPNHAPDQRPGRHRIVIAIAAQRIAPGAARDIPLGFTAPPLPRTTPLPPSARCRFRGGAVPRGRAIAYELDVYRDGSPTFVFDNGACAS